MDRVYTYHTIDHHITETSFSMQPELAFKTIEEGGYIKVWNAKTPNASELIDTLVTSDEVESIITAEERKIWFKNSESTPKVDPSDCEGSWEHLKKELSENNPVRQLGDQIIKEGSKIDAKSFVEQGKMLDELTLTSSMEAPADTNVKSAAAVGKPTFAAVPPIAFFGLGAAMQDGAKKYGRFNWRTTEVTASVFYDAMLRHIFMWWNGEDHATDSLIHHLNHMQAGAAIIQDAELNGVFNNDRDMHHMVDIDAIMKIVKRKA